MKKSVIYLLKECNDYFGIEYKIVGYTALEHEAKYWTERKTGHYGREAIEVPLINMDQLY